MRNEFFDKYVSNLKMEDNYIWKHVKNKRKPKPISKYATPPEPSAKSDKEELELFAERFPKFSHHNITIRAMKWSKT